MCVSGTWAINTDHASVLNRQPKDWMTWTPISVDLAWLRFHDMHTGIDHYEVNIGSQYMDSDFNIVSSANVNKYNNTYVRMAYISKTSMYSNVFELTTTSNTTFCKK